MGQDQHQKGYEGADLGGWKDGGEQQKQVGKRAEVAGAGSTLPDTETLNVGLSFSNFILSGKDNSRGLTSLNCTVLVSELRSFPRVPPRF